MWGGSAGDPGDRAPSDGALSDGALYDPSTDRWTLLPRLTVSGDAISEAVWTGNRVVLFTAAGGWHTRVVYVHAYDPIHNSWTALASVHISQTALLGVSALATDHQLYVWAPVQTIAAGSLTPANDGFDYDVDANAWRATSLLPARDGYSVGDVIWSGDHVIFGPDGLDCTCGGIAGASNGTWADPATGHLHRLPPWQSPPSEGSVFSWTGAAIVAVHDAQARAWNPARDTWLRLPSAPFGAAAVQLWTGSRLLSWGQLTAAPSTDPNAASPPPTAVPTGMELAP